MQALDERMLKDIGIDRSEIDSIVRGLGRDASRVNAMTLTAKLVHPQRRNMP